MEMFTATGKLKSFFLTTRDVRCVHHRWHGTHRYDIQVLATHASTCVHRYSSLLQRSLPLGQWGQMAMVGRILCTKYTLHSNHRLTVWYSNTQNDFSPPERSFSNYLHSHRLAAEMWTTMENYLLGKKCLSCSFCLYRFGKYVSYGFPIINACNRGVHYETPCIATVAHHTVNKPHSLRMTRKKRNRKIFRKEPTDRTLSAPILPSCEITYNVGVFHKFQALV